MRYIIINRDDDFSKKMSSDIVSFMSKDSFFIKDEKDPELIIVIGGDGTFLHAMHKYADKLDSIKFLCFNTGTIGYYNEFDVHKYEETIKSIKENLLPTREFSLLEYSSKNQSHYAINEFIFSGLIKNVEYDVYLDGEKLERYFGMGLVIATSTGSMGYNRSINGSIMDINVDGMEVTEIAAIHSKAYSSVGSPLILDKKRVLTFKEVNGRSGYILKDNILVNEKTDDEFSIFISKKKAVCYSIEKDPFLARLKKTLGF